MYLTLILTWSFSTLSFLILVPVKSRTVKLGQRSCKKMAHSVDEFLADWYNMLILWIYVKVHLYFCVGYEAEWRNFHKQSGFQRESENENIHSTFSGLVVEILNPKFTRFISGVAELYRNLSGECSGLISYSPCSNDWQDNNSNNCSHIGFITNLYYRKNLFASQPTAVHQAKLFQLIS